MATMVESLFGITPEMYTQARDQRADEQALAFARLSPFEKASFGISRGAYGLAGAAGRALGGEDPELRRISARNAIARQINYTDPSSIQQGIQALAQADDVVGAMQLTDIFRKLQSEQALAAQRAAAGQASLAEARLKEAELAEIKRQQDAFEQEFGPTPAPAAAATAPTDVLGDFIQEQVARAEGRPVRGPAFELAAAAEPAGLAPAPAAAPAAAPAPAVKTRKAIEDEIAALQKRKARLSTFTKLPNAKDLASQLDTQIKALQDQIAPTEIGKLEREIEQFRAAGVPDTDQRIQDRRAKIDKLTGAAERFGTDREAISKELFQGRPFRDLTPTEAAVVNARVQQNKRETTPTNPVTINMQKGFGEDLQETISGAMRGSRSAASTLSNVRNMKTLIDAGVRTGFAQEQILALGRAGQLINPDFNVKGLAGQEAFLAFSNNVVLPEVKKLGANPTDTDLKFIVSGAPGLSKTPEGNKLMLDALDLKLQREIDYGAFSTTWLTRNSALVKADPISARAKFEVDFQQHTKTSPLYDPAANNLRDRYAALGGQTRGSEPARRALRSGGLIN